MIRGLNSQRLDLIFVKAKVLGIRDVLKHGWINLVSVESTENAFISGARLRPTVLPWIGTWDSLSLNSWICQCIYYECIDCACSNKRPIRLPENRGKLGHFELRDRSVKAIAIEVSQTKSS